VNSLVASRRVNSFMKSNRLRRIEVTIEELLSQPERIKDTLNAEEDKIKLVARRIAEINPNRILIAGCGDSFYSGIALQRFLEECFGTPVEAHQSFEVARYCHGRADRDSVLFALSMTGTTQSTLECVDTANTNGCYTVGITSSSGAWLTRVELATYIVLSSSNLTSLYTPSTTTLPPTLLKQDLASIGFSGSICTVSPNRLGGLPYSCVNARPKDRSLARSTGQKLFLK
jgi:DNA-binding MurR/RpiR family transcriptional regulator